MMATKKKLPTLAAWRERMGFSLRDTCAALGCSKQAWIDWEHGRRPAPRYIYLAMSAVAAGMTPEGES